MKRKLPVLTRPACVSWCWFTEPGLVLPAVAAVLVVLFCILSFPFPLAKIICTVNIQFKVHVFTGCHIVSLF